MKYVYPAIFIPEDDGRLNVDFPDLTSCYTFGDNLTDAIDMARDVAAMRLCHAEDNQENLPSPSSIDTVTAPENGFVSLIDIDTQEYRRENDNRAVKKTLSIPSWLNSRAERAGINFSQVLQEALKDRLEIQV